MARPATLPSPVRLATTHHVEIKPAAGDVPRKIQQAIGGTVGALFKPVDNINLGVAKVTNLVAGFVPSMPAAHLMSWAIGVPHTHIFPPPAPPIPVPPLPAPPVGMVTFGGCYQVLINSMPAARCGDIGFSPTCLNPTGGMFEIFTGSSSVFVGGSRAARMTDFTKHCWPSLTGYDASAFARNMFKATMFAMKIVQYSGHAAQVAGAVADGTDAAAAAAAQGGAAMAVAKTQSALATAAQMAADIAAMAISKLMLLKLPGLPPTGMMSSGSTNVLIGGLPFPSGMSFAMRHMGAMIEGSVLKKRNQAKKGKAGKG